MSTQGVSDLARATATDLGHTKHIEEVADDFGDHIRPHIEQAKRQVSRYGDRITNVIQDHPAVCLLGAIAIGYFVARVMRHRN